MGNHFGDVDWPWECVFGVVLGSAEASWDDPAARWRNFGVAESICRGIEFSENFGKNYSILKVKTSVLSLSWKRNYIFHLNFSQTTLATLTWMLALSAPEVEKRPFSAKRPCNGSEATPAPARNFIISKILILKFNFQIDGVGAVKAKPEEAKELFEEELVGDEAADKALEYLAV